MIYQLLLTYGWIRVLRASSRRFDTFADFACLLTGDTLRCNGHRLDIARTCRQIRDEALTVYFQSNGFCMYDGELSLPEDVLNLREWALERVPERHRGSLRRIALPNDCHHDTDIFMADASTQLLQVARFVYLGIEHILPISALLASLDACGFYEAEIYLDSIVCMALDSRWQDEDEEGFNWRFGTWLRALPQWDFAFLMDTRLWIYRERLYEDEDEYEDDFDDEEGDE